MFPRNKNYKSGIDTQCKSCANARSRANYAKDPAKKIAKTRQYHIDHPEWSKRVQREWHVRNAERRYEEYRERGKDPEVAARRREATRRCESRRRAVKSGDKDAPVITEQDYTDILVKYDEKCWICAVDLTTVDWHWDHYKPLSKGGLHRVDNLRPACEPCNIRKNGIWPITEDRLGEIRDAVQSSRKSKASE